MSDKRFWNIRNTLKFSLVASLVFGTLSKSLANDVVSLDQHPVIQNPLWLKDAVHVRVTPRGQKLFSDDLMQIITNLGVVINENYFPEFKYVTDEPIKIEQLAKKQPQEFKMLLDVRNFFKQYLQGIQFKDFKPSIEIGDSEYIAEFNRLSLVTDHELMKSLGKSDGAVLAIEMEIRSLDGKAEFIRAEDLENPWFGKVGVTKPEISMASKDVPLIARMPFYVRINEQGILHFEALKIEENIDRIPIEIKYRRVVLPEFEFKVVGQNQTFKIKVNEDEFKKVVDQHLPDGLRLIRKYVREFLQEELPKTLNEKAQASLKQELEQIQPIPAPNTLEDDIRPPLSLGLKLSKLNLVDKNWAISLSAFIEDTSIMARTPFWERSGARGAPVFNHLPAENYDLAIAVDRAVFNRAIHLASNRNNFKVLELEGCPGKPKPPKIELLSGPSVDFDNSAKSKNDLEANLVVFVDANVEVPEEYRKVFGIPVLKDKLHLTMKYRGVIRPAREGSAKLSIIPTGADLDSVWVDSNSLRIVGKMFEGRVLKEVKEILSNGTSCDTGGAAESDPKPIAEFELIKSLLGIPLEYAKIKMDPQGQLMMYMNYKKVNPGRRILK